MYIPPHEVRDKKKFESMIAALKMGQKLPPVVVVEGSPYALTGSHRLAAWKALGMEPDVVEVSQEDYAKACLDLWGEVKTWEEIYDFDEFCEALYRVTGDPDVRLALSEQM